MFFIDIIKIHPQENSFSPLRSGIFSRRALPWLPTAGQIHKARIGPRHHRCGIHLVQMDSVRVRRFVRGAARGAPALLREKGFSPAQGLPAPQKRNPDCAEKGLLQKGVGPLQYLAAPELQFLGQHPVFRAHKQNAVFAAQGLRQRPQFRPHDRFPVLPEQGKARPPLPRAQTLQHACQHIPHADGLFQFFTFPGRAGHAFSLVRSPRLRAGSGRHTPRRAGFAVRIDYMRIC